jgi:hypothetical protein
MNATIRYLTTVVDDRHATELLVEPDGRARLSVGSNRDQRARPVGRFEAALPADLLRRLQEATADPAFAAAPAQATLVPDESYRSIEWRRAGGASVTKVVGEQLAPPAAFVRAESAIAEAIALVARAPLQALALRLTPPKPTHRLGQPLALELHLANVGRDPLRLAAPRAWGRGGTSATIGALRADVAPAAQRPEDQRFVALDGAAFTGADKKALLAEDTFLLAPQARVLLGFAVPIDLAVGRWAIEIDYEVAGQAADGAVLFEAALFTEPVTIEIVRS